MNNTSPTIGSNNTSSSTTEEVPSKQEGIAICSLFVLEAALIVVGNLLTIVLSGNASMIFKSHRSNQHTFYWSKKKHSLRIIQFQYPKAV